MAVAKVLYGKASQLCERDNFRATHITLTLKEQTMEIARALCYTIARLLNVLLLSGRSMETKVGCGQLVVS